MDVLLQGITFTKKIKNLIIVWWRRERDSLDKLTFVKIFVLNILTNNSKYKTPIIFKI
jgi:hypothetical protein